MSPLVSNLETNRRNRLCSFVVDLDEIDIASKLHEIAATNRHVAGWSVIEQRPVSAAAVDDVPKENAADSEDDDVISDEQDSSQAVEASDADSGGSANDNAEDF